MVNCNTLVILAVLSWNTSYGQRYMGKPFIDSCTMTFKPYPADYNVPYMIWEEKVSLIMTPIVSIRGAGS